MRGARAELTGIKYRTASNTNNKATSSAGGVREQAGDQEHDSFSLSCYPYPHPDSPKTHLPLFVVAVKHSFPIPFSVPQVQLTVWSPNGDSSSRSPPCSSRSPSAVPDPTPCAIPDPHPAVSDHPPSIPDPPLQFQIPPLQSPIPSAIQDPATSLN